jgi:peroxiredoxin
MIGFAHGQQIVLKGTKGETITDRQLLGAKATVYYFLSPECPLCQSYSLTLKQLAAIFAGKGIVMGIIPGTDYSNLDIASFKLKYGIPFHLWKDEQMLFSKKMGATITPEAVVVDAKGKVVYQGRINNWAYELAKKRSVITEHDLQDALNSVLKNEPVKVAKTKAIGCYIE